MSAVRTLARGWRRGAIRWYLGTAAVLGLSITLLLVISGLFAGMQAETQSRVADFYTSDVRVTSAGEGAIPGRTFFDLNATKEQLGVAGKVAIHYESQAILSRRAFIEAALNEDDQFQVGAGGRDGDGDEVIALGALVGIEAGGRDRANLERHLVVGALPGQGTGKGSMPLVMSLDRFEQFLTAKERAEFTMWPPAISQIRDLSFEITAAVVIQDEASGTRDVIRSPAHVIGLYDSGVDVLDSFTYVAAIEDVRLLNDHEADAPVANVIVVDTADPERVAALAARNGWTSQSAEQFTQRYLGQLIDVLQSLSVLVSIFLFMLPAFLILHGVGRQLETHNREIAVCHAIGVRPGTVRRALGGVVAQVTGVAILVAALFTTLIGATLHAVLPGRRDLPLPMDFQPTLMSMGLAVGITLLSVGAALWLAFRSQARQELSTTLRTF